MSDIERSVGKALLEPDFAKSLARDPERALKEVGIEPTPEILDGLRGIDLKALSKAAETFSGPRRAI
ncbi:MAG: Os1348 family NHLP clan protein [Anaerolineae bacterium]